MQYIIKKKAKAPKAYKTRLSSEKRVYPKGGETMTTQAYIVAYYTANASVFGCSSGDDVYTSIFSPHACAPV